MCGARVGTQRWEGEGGEDKKRRKGPRREKRSKGENGTPIYFCSLLAPIGEVHNPIVRLGRETPKKNAPVGSETTFPFDDVCFLFFLAAWPKHE